MKMRACFLSLLFLATAARADLAAAAPTPLDPASAARELTVVPNNVRLAEETINPNVSRMAAAFKEIKADRERRALGRARSNRKLIPALDVGFNIGQSIGKAANWLPKKIHLNLNHSPQEETSLGLGLAAFGYGYLTKRKNKKRFEEMNFAVQNKYKMNGIYLASLEDENIEIRFCNKRLQKTLDKATRHRKDMLTKLHLSITPS